MSQIIGKIKSIIYENDANGYLVALFKVSNGDETTKEYFKKTITINGTFLDIKMETKTLLEGEFVKHEKYGMQFKVNNYEYLMPSTNDDIIEFLKSKFVKGCGKKTAEKIVLIYGDKSIETIKNDIHSLDVIDIPIIKKQQIYDSLINYSKSSDLIIKLKNLGFSIEEAGKIYNKYKDRLQDILDNNIYLLNEVIDFKRIDNIFLNNYNDKYDKRRIKACIIETMKFISINKGDIYYHIGDVYNILNKLFNLSLDYENYLDYINELEKEFLIVNDNDNLYLQNNYEDEINISSYLKKISNNKNKVIDYEKEINDLEKKLDITYNDDQKRAIITSLNSNITIISGGPGTGKTTIVDAIVKLYIKENKLNGVAINEDIALLAPTGRASKKLSLVTGLQGMTIHRYLKWNKDTNDFGINEKNKNIQKLIIVDEVSMIDSALFCALLKGIHSYVKLVLVGDAFQLPSVGPGLILSDLINSDLFNFVPLNYIYRQSDNSYIPYLAREIKNQDLAEEFINKHDDYNFIACDNKSIVNTIKMVIDAGIKKGYNENNLQVLIPIYKGDNGIDNINKILCELFNPYQSQNRVVYNDIIYKENDKVLQLINDTDNNVFNGDIGYIDKIYIMGKKELVRINFDDNIVIYEKKDLKNIKHAYAISIHKSQGSEFDHVIMPISYSYGNMLYNKILYTGVSRAKKSLVLIGDISVFYKSVFNEYGSGRKTTLQDRLREKFYT